MSVLNVKGGGCVHNVANVSWRLHYDVVLIFIPSADGAITSILRFYFGRNGH